MNKLLVNCLFFLLFIGRIAAQTELDKIMQRAEKHIQDAERHYAEMKYTQAKESYQFAARLYRNNNVAQPYAVCYNGIGNIYIDLSLYEEAKNEGFDRALQLLSQIPAHKVDSSLIADAYEGLGRYYASLPIVLPTDKTKKTKIHFDKALEYHQKALGIRLRKFGQEHQAVARSYYYMSFCYRGFALDITSETANNPITQELELLKKALVLQLKTIGDEDHQTANTYQALGNFYYEAQKDYYKGFEYHQQAFKIRQKKFKHHPQIASSLVDMAVYYREMNLFREEMNCLEKALEIQLSILGKNHSEIAKSYYLLANRYRFSGNFKKAILYYNDVLEIYKTLHLEQSAEVAETHLALALSYRGLKQPNLDWSHLEESRKIYASIFGKKHFKTAWVLLEFGAYYLEKKMYDSTLYYYNNALEVEKQQLGERHYSIADIYDKMAELYQLVGDKRQELNFLYLSLQTKNNLGANRKSQKYERTDANVGLDWDSEKKNKTFSQQLYISYLNLALYFKRETQYLVALKYIQQALASVCSSLEKSKEDIYSNPPTQELTYNIFWLQAIREKALLFRLLYEYNSRSEKDLEFSIKTYYQAVEVAQLLHTNFTADDYRQELFLHTLPVYEEAIAALYLLYVRTKKNQYLDKAFEITEQSKTFVLLHVLQNNLAKGSSNIPQELLEREKKLRQQLSYYSNYKNRNNQDGQKFEKLYFQTKSSYDSLVVMLEEKYPNYYNLKYKNKTTNCKEVQKYILQKDNLLLEYFIGNKYLYVFRITPTEKKMFRISIPPNYEQLVNDLRNALTNYSLVATHPQWAYSAFCKASSNLYKQLVAPFIKYAPNTIQKLTIIPDGWLNFIPFEVLLSEMPPTGAGGTNYQKLPFLLKKYEMNYSYSATLLYNNIQNTYRKNNGQCLGFAPSIALQGAANLDSLPWTKKELEVIEKIFDGTYFFGTKATQTAFKENAGNFSILHLATHGIVDMEEPLRSYLAFAPDTTDGFLYAYDIHNLAIQADLVVLSACETGFGTTVNGEGVLSLARAFLYAGAPSVVTTLWQVNDFASAALVEVFYSNLAKGMSKSQALQQAKLTFLSKTNEISGHPSYWGSFIIIGNPEPLPRNQYWLWLAMLAGGIIVMGVIWKLRK